MTTNDNDDDDVDEEAIKRKIDEYSQFVTKTLRPQLATAEQAAKVIEQEIADYQSLGEELQRWLSISNENLSQKANCPTKVSDVTSSGDNNHAVSEGIDNETRPPQVLVDLGHGKVWCNAVFNDLASTKEEQMVFVHVGMGFHVEMKLSEAIRFTNQRILYLGTHKLTPRRDDVVRIRRHVQQSETILDTLSRELSRSQSRY